METEKSVSVFSTPWICIIQVPRSSRVTSFIFLYFYKNSGNISDIIQKYADETGEADFLTRFQFLCTNMAYQRAVTN